MWERARQPVVIVAAVAAVWLMWPRVSTPGPAGVVEITYWAQSGAAGTHRDAIDEFERRCARKGRPVRVITGNAAIRNAVDDPQRFLTGVAGGTPPDVIWFNRYAIAQWAVRGAFQPLIKDFIKVDEAKLERLEAELVRARRAGDANGVSRLEAEIADFRAMLIRPEEFYKNCWEESLYKGEQYGIANSTDSRGLFYNCDLLIQGGFVYGADDPEVSAGRAKAGDARPPRTWEETCLKRADARDGVVTDQRHLSSGSVDFAAAGVVKGDHVCLDPAGAPQLARVIGVEPHRLTLETVSNAPRDGADVWFKVFDGSTYSLRMTRWDERGRLRVIGWAPQWGNSWLYLFGWQNGGRFMSPDGEEVTLNDPKIVEALQWMVDCYDALGAYKAVSAFQATWQGEVLDPFLTGKVAMKVDGNDFANIIAMYKRDKDFGAEPAPMPARELAKGRRPVSWMAGWAYAIPATAKHKAEAWEFIKWMVSWEANRMRLDIVRDLCHAKGQLYFPPVHPKIRVCEGFYERYLKGQPNIPQRFDDAYQMFKGLLLDAHHLPFTPVGNRLWTEHRRAMERALNHDPAYPTPKAALDYGKRVVQRDLDRLLTPPTGKVVNWYWLIGIYLALIVVVGVGVYVHHSRKYRSRGYWRREWWAGLVCASPWIVGFLVFTAGPILFSILMSFSDYDVINPAHWLGLGNYREAFGDPLFYTSLANTVYMVMGVPLGLIVGLAMAMLLDSGVRGLSTYRTIYYLPAIVPAVASSVLWIWVFHPSEGMINSLFDAVGVNTALEWLGFSRWFGVSVPINWLGETKMAKPSLIIMGLWGAGAGMLIWLAGLKGVPEHLYEAASIDGANVWHRFRHVTLPMLSPYILFNLVMGTIGVFQIFTQAYIMTEGGPNDATLFYAYNLFNQAFRYLRMGYASALAWVLFAIVFALTLVQLYFSRKWVHYESP
ncbi:MAG: extracellular solute-binding protein [Phycisphaerae bacterium]|nr:extracellular solute-binding protein [Phycisphaerae bacterium]